MMRRRNEDPLSLRIRGRSVEVTEVMRDHVARQLGFALGPFRPRIEQVSVQFSDVGAEHRCQIDVKLRRRHVRAEDSDTAVFAAIDRAAHRASRSIARALERDGERGNATIRSRAPDVPGAEARAGRRQP